MKYKKIDLNDYEIYYLNTNKFKTIDILTFFISDYDKSDITKDNVITEFLINTNNRFKDEVSMSKNNMELYEPRISINDVFTTKHAKMIDMRFLNEKYTEEGMNKKTIDFYYSLIFDPNIDKGGFDKTNFDITVDKIKSRIKMDKEMPRVIAFNNFIKNIKEDVPLKVDSSPKLKDLKFNRKELYDYYKNEIDKSKVVVFVTGEINDDLINVIKSNLDKKVKKNDYEIQKYFDLDKVIKAREIVKKTDFNQSIIYILYKIYNMTRRERNVILPVLNEILGGSSSKLFNNVREKNSLAYYVYSSFAPTSSMLYLSAGIEKSNYKKAVKLMKEQVNELVNGNITDEELNNALETLSSSLIEKEDSIVSLTHDISTVVIYDRMTSEELLKENKTVTKEEIINLAKKLDLDFVFLLEGDK